MGNEYFVKNWLQGSLSVQEKKIFEATEDYRSWVKFHRCFMLLMLINKVRMRGNRRLMLVNSTDKIGSILPGETAKTYTVFS